MMPALDRIVDADAINRLARHDATLFAVDGVVPDEVEDRMGWTSLSEPGRKLAERLESLAKEYRREGLEDVVLIGMGGSSLASLVISSVLGPASPRVHVLDTVSPDTVRRVMDRTNPATTAYLVSSKSGGTIEPNALYAIFRDSANRALGEAAAGKRFVAITDPGSGLEELAKRSGFRAIVHAAADVGGRFSALTAFGLVPAALIGVDLETLLDRAASAEHACRESFEENPAAELASFIVDAHEQGADKLTVVACEKLRSFGLWTEQLVAESLGKQGEGIVPVVELANEPSGYGADRAVCVFRMTGDRQLAEWAQSQRGVHPVYEIVLDDEYDIAEEFVRWEYAIALVGHLLGVNPFDQPNVAEAKAATIDVLNGAKKPLPATLSVDGVDLTYVGIDSPEHVERTLATSIGHAFGAIKEGDYVAILAYLPDDDVLLEPLYRAVLKVSAELGAAICLELGPRYLHSTGQLHKGGPNEGVFVMVTSQESTDIDVPDQPWTLRTLHLSQAQGDLTALAAHGRRVLHLDLPDSQPQRVSDLAEALIQAAGVVYESLRV